jgi:hypothetical protein
MQDKKSAIAGNQWPEMRDNGEPEMPKECPLSAVQQRVVGSGVLSQHGQPVVEES